MKRKIYQNIQNKFLHNKQHKTNTEYYYILNDIFNNLEYKSCDEPIEIRLYDLEYKSCNETTSIRFRPKLAPFKKLQKVRSNDEIKKSIQRWNSLFLKINSKIIKTIDD